MERLGWMFVLAVLVFSGCDGSEDVAEDSASAEENWVADAVFYQIFPERFHNGDQSNDPTRESLEFPEIVPDSWAPTSWTADWYSRAPWEIEMGDDFYEDGVFHRRLGGDLQGVKDKIAYLKDLGITAIYFNPVFYARSLHKYDGNSFHHIDPYFGPDPAGDFALMATETADPASWKWTEADKLFLDVVKTAHDNNIKVVIDGVFNHTGRNFFAFMDIVDNQEASTYKDWYIVEAFDDPSTADNEFKYEGWWGYDTLPLFADTPDGTDLHPGPKQYVMDITRRWMDPDGDGSPIDGVDGWRLDVAPDVPIRFWKDWNTYVRELNPKAYTVGEYWDNAATSLVAGGFSATMNYHGFAQPVKGFMIDEKIEAPEFVQLLDERRDEYSPSMQLALQNLMDSHDTDRLASMIVNPKSTYRDAGVFDYDRDVSPRGGGEYDLRAPTDLERRRQQLIALFQMTYVGPPMIYYGTEAGMWGADDPDDRQPMVWPDLEYEPQKLNADGSSRPEDIVEFDEELFSYYQSLINIRKNSRALRRGSFAPYLNSDFPKAFAFTRIADGEAIVVGINIGDSAAKIGLPGVAVSAETLFVGDSSQFAEVDGQIELIIPPQSGVVIE